MSSNRFGKVKFSAIMTPIEKGVWCYSYQELQDQLNEVCKNHTLKKAYADLEGYLESHHSDSNYYDFSYMGGPVILLFDNIGVEFCVDGVGLVQYRLLNLWDVKIKKHEECPCDDIGKIADNYFYDLSKQFQLSYEDQKVLEITVDPINTYPFIPHNFDREKAALAEKTSSLPTNIHFHLGNGVDFGIYGDHIENFYIELKK